MRAIEERLASTSEGSREAEALLWKHHGLQEKLEASGYHRRTEIDRARALGLGFPEPDLRQPCSSFSAGWQMRIALARAIMESPDILLLDEPTNYLDLEARTWLEEFLRDFPGGLLLVSHDRYFLDVSVSSVAEIYMARVSRVPGHLHPVRAGARQRSWRRSWPAGRTSRRRSPASRSSYGASATRPPRPVRCRAGSTPWSASSASRCRPS